MLQSGFAQTPMMNELFSRGVPTELDWIEIYNPTSSSIDITGYKIYDSGGFNGTKPKKLFPGGSVIPANGFLVIITDDTDPSGFGLSSSGEKVWFENASGTVIDSVDLVEITDTSTSYGRLPDGSANWQILVPRTRGFSNVVTDVENEVNSISEFRLNQNYPNPFNPSTTINYSLPFESNVKITIFNLLGEVVTELVNSGQQSGYHSVSFKAADISSGIYFYAISASSIDGQQNFNSVRKMTLLK